MTVLLSLACTSAPPPAPAPEIAELALPVSLEDLGGMLRRPSENPRIFNFWATWCGPCVAELPLLQAIADQNPEVEVLLVDLDLLSVRESKVLPFLTRHDVRLPSVLLDHADPAWAMTQVLPSWPATIPVTIIVGRDGRISQQFNGAIAEPSQLQSALSER